MRDDTKAKRAHLRQLKAKYDRLILADATSTPDAELVREEIVRLAAELDPLAAATRLVVDP